MSQIAKAVNAGCRTEQEAFGKVLSAEHIMQEYKDGASEKALNTGWNFNCLAATAAP